MDAEGRNIQRLETAVRELEGRLCRLREELGVAREERRLALALAVAVEEGEGEGEESVVGSRGDGDRDRYGDEDRDKERQCSATTWSWPMKREEYKRYGRQLIMPEIGIGGMIFLLSFLLYYLGVLFLVCHQFVNAWWEISGCRTIFVTILYFSNHHSVGMFFSYLFWILQC